MDIKLIKMNPLTQKVINLLSTMFVYVFVLYVFTGLHCLCVSFVTSQFLMFVMSILYVINMFIISTTLAFELDSGYNTVKEYIDYVAREYNKAKIISSPSYEETLVNENSQSVSLKELYSNVNSTLCDILERIQFLESKIEELNKHVELPDPSFHLVEEQDDKSLFNILKENENTPCIEDEYTS